MKQSEYKRLKSQIIKAYLYGHDDYDRLMDEVAARGSNAQWNDLTATLDEVQQSAKSAGDQALQNHKWPGSPM